MKFKKMRVITKSPGKYKKPMNYLIINLIK